jgi:hypothetical protein
MPHADSHRPAARDHRRRPQSSRDGRPVSGVLGLGYTDVATYIQSGNVVLASEEADTAMIAAALERAIAEHLGVRPKVVVLTRAELARVAADNPFPEEPNLRWVHAIFRNGPSGPTSSPPWQPPSSEPATRQRPRGAGGRKHLVPAYPRWPRPQRAGRPTAPSRWFPNCRAGCTARNWATVNKLLALCNP